MLSPRTPPGARARRSRADDSDDPLGVCIPADRRTPVGARADRSGNPLSVSGGSSQAFDSGARRCCCGIGQSPSDACQSDAASSGFLRRYLDGDRMMPRGPTCARMGHQPTSPVIGSMPIPLLITVRFDPPLEGPVPSSPRRGERLGCLPASPARRCALQVGHSTGPQLIQSPSQASTTSTGRSGSVGRRHHPLPSERVVDQGSAPEAGARSKADSVSGEVACCAGSTAVLLPGVPEERDRFRNGGRP